MIEESQENSEVLRVRGFQPINKAVDQSIVIVKNAMHGKRDVYPTQWTRLNKNLLGGLQKGKMYVIAGRPGVGKSAFSNQLIFDVLDKNQSKNSKLCVADLKKLKKRLANCYQLKQGLTMKTSKVMPIV